MTIPMRVHLTVNRKTCEVELPAIDCQSLDDVLKSAELLYPDLTSLVFTVTYPTRWNDYGKRTPAEKNSAEAMHWASAP